MGTVTALLMWTVLQSQGGPRVLLEVDCKIPTGRVLLTGGVVATTCPGLQRITMPAQGDVQLMLLFAGKVSVQKMVTLSPDKMTRVVIDQELAVPRMKVDLVAVTDGEIASAPLDTLDVEKIPLEETTRPVEPSFESLWKGRVAGGVSLLGGVVFVMGLAMMATAVTRMFVGDTGPQQTFPNTGVFAAFTSFSLIGAPLLLGMGVMGCLAGAVAVVGGLVWGRVG